MSKKNIIFLLILLVACFFRFNNLNWDDNFHLHPDERFLTMVGNAMRLPNSFNQYFDQKTSLLNPSNIGYDFFVYGRFPLILTKYLAVYFSLDNYNDFTILGRYLSAFFDFLIIIFVFKTVLLLERHYKFSPAIKYWASFFYAIAVLPIQLSHFFAVDTFLNFFMFGSFYFSLKFYYERKIKYLFFSATFFGLATASKITAIFILPLNLFFIFWNYRKRLGQNINISKYSLLIFVYFIISYLILRLTDPYLFQSTNFLNPQLNKDFLQSLKQLQSFLQKKDLWYPPSIQWISKIPLLFSLINLIVFGVGILSFGFIIIGMGWIILNIKRQILKINSKLKIKKINLELAVILIWVVGFFFYQGTRFNPAMRYFIFIYPFLAIFAGIGIFLVTSLLLRYKNKLLFSFFPILIIFLLLIWPLMFSSIYFNKHTRVEASEWIYKNLPSGSIILGEEWDDLLPLPVVDHYNKYFIVKQLPVFLPDTEDKWQKMNYLLSNADYYILSSNRGWGSIITVPEKYPKMSQFYKQLLNGELSYKKIKEFNPYYYRFFQLPNNWIDESFTVYDHPQVFIFKNEK